MKHEEEELDSDLSNDDLYQYKNIRVDPGQDPVRIDKFLIDRLSNTSRNRIQNAIKAGSVRVDGKEIKPNFKIKAGQEIQIVLPKPQ